MRYLYPLFIINLFCAIAQAEDSVLEIVSEHWPPYIVQDAHNSNEISGIVTKKIRAIFDNSPLKYQISIYPWARSYHLATTKPNVLIYSIYKTEKRTPHFKWFCPIHSKTPVYVYKLKTNNINISALLPLKNAIVGVLRDDNSHHFMLDNGFTEGRNIIVSSNEEGNIKKLLKNRIDAVIQSKEALIFRIKNTGFTIDDFVAGYQLHQGTNTEHCMALSKNSAPEVVTAVETAFNNWLQNQARY